MLYVLFFTAVVCECVFKCVSNIFFCFGSKALEIVAKEDINPTARLSVEKKHIYTRPHSHFENALFFVVPHRTWFSHFPWHFVQAFYSHSTTKIKKILNVKKVRVTLKDLVFTAHKLLCR